MIVYVYIKKVSRCFIVFYRYATAKKNKLSWIMQDIVRYEKNKFTSLSVSSFYPFFKSNYATLGELCINLCHPGAPDVP